MANADVFLYADDTAIVCSGDDKNQIVSDMTKHLEAASTWLNDHRLSLNLNKTKCMFFVTTPRLKNLTGSQMLFNKEVIEIIDQFKYLGVVLDRPLKFKAHVDYLIKKVTPKLRRLGRI